RIDAATTLTMEYSDVRGLHLPRTRALLPVYFLEQASSSSYQGMAVAVNRRMTKEVAYLIAYNLGRTRDDASDYDEQPNDPRNVGAEWGLSREHQGHGIAGSGVFEVMDNLTMSPIVVYGSGRPLNTLLTTDPARTGAYPISARPDGVARNSHLMPATV